MSGSGNTQFAVAVHVLTFLACVAQEPSPAPVSSEVLASTTRSNPVHVRRVLGPLRERGIVGSHGGRRGGWELRRPAAQVHLDEVWAAVRDSPQVVGLHSPDPSCPVARSVGQSLAALEGRLHTVVAAELARTTIADLIPDLPLPDGDDALVAAGGQGWRPVMPG